ncbi:hypothetical protein CGRA01v4_03452 [Colletotrichum graminicola]|nr:hypothetical protein CGRA01v4_03452 [Colletotrichum graminicola]
MRSRKPYALAFASAVFGTIRQPA